ncbi:TIM-barrel domain-containing protein [Janthinobacterium fluminis]|uniref:Glycoside hydrolase family 31 protein n=1 Tax=Janthinobacterium fluminis TaxID=2987524 RepID=A0ABT5JZK4_9BURK|nr:TIM-barrel domain-containing protein [Janthinobacterium fluminis]MDC8757875.1 glycoside hydrolase family 31 protein [Janthinobacterium fluminis]
MPPVFRSTVIAAAAALLCAAAAAAPVGNLSRIGPHEGGFELRTDRGVALRVGMPAPGVLRIQAGPGGKFGEAGDKAAPIVLRSAAAPLPLRVSELADHHLLRGEGLALRIYKKPLRFALYKADNATLLWQETQPLELGADNSFQTLSAGADEHFFGGGQQNGAFDFKGKALEVSYSGGWEEGDRPNPAPFYMSSKGYGVLRNTWSNGSYDFRSNDYLSASHREHRFDAYYFAGDGIADVLAAYTALTGRAALLPRWAYEYGDADCYNDGDNVKKPGTVPAGWSDGPTGTTPDVIESVAAKYREHDMPGGWILPNDGYGCGYTDLPKVVAGLKKYGFRTGLWTENGVEKIKWEVGSAGTRAQKLDVAWTGKGYQFALDANSDAANGILANSDARPFLWTVMGWAGMQRYAVTWTGDQSGSWDYIRWHIPTLIGSGLSGQAYATGDVDGIFGGSPETYTRDLQWKAFTPVLMGMSGWSKSERKHPWWFDEPYRSINRDYLKLKMRLTPYMYTYARQAEQSGAPIVRGLMWDHPRDPHANGEAHKYQFFLGRDFLVAPVYRSQAASGGWRKNVYLPQGSWIDYWDGRVLDAGAAGRLVDYPVTLDKLPVLVRAGAIIPMYPAALYDGQVAKDVLTLDIYPHGAAAFTLYEDDGETRQYRQGSFSTQTFAVAAPEGKAGDIGVEIGAVAGDYAGLEERRVYRLQVHTRARPSAVTLQGQALPELATLAAFEQAGAGWFYDAADRYGLVHVKTASVAVRQAYRITLAIDAGAALAATPEFGSAPALGNAVAADSIVVLGRPAEEPGHKLENAFDGKPGTWFRTVRDQSQKTGPHEFVLALGERRMVAGFEIAPRDDKHWKSGQVRDFELYLGERNGEWGKPVFTGRLALRQDMQKVEFPARPGSLLRFRVLSTQEQAEDPTVQDPMVTASSAGAAAPKAFNAFAPTPVNPITISEFRVLQASAPERPKQQLYLSGAPARPLQMNGLKFRQGLAVAGGSRIDYRLKGDWQLFRADVGVDDSCGQAGAMQFQVYGDGKLLFDSGALRAPAVVKPELDVRGIAVLSLRTSGARGKACANWANATLLGFEGDKAER